MDAKHQKGNKISMKKAENVGKEKHLRGEKKRRIYNKIHQDLQWRGKCKKKKFKKNLGGSI
jgi:hypothetical protein